MNMAHLENSGKRPSKCDPKKEGGIYSPFFGGEIHKLDMLVFLGVNMWMMFGSSDPCISYLLTWILDFYGKLESKYTSPIDLILVMV